MKNDPRFQTDTLGGFLSGEDFGSASRTDVPHISVARIKGGDLPLLGYGPFELLIVPIDPIQLLVTIDDGPQSLLNVSPFTVCNFRPRGRISIVGTEDVELIAIAIDRAWCNEICAKSGTEYSGLSDISERILHPEVPPIVLSIRRQIMNRDCPPEPFLKTYVTVLLSHLVWNNSTATVVKTSTGLTKAQLHDILFDIDKAIDTPIRVSEVAEKYGLTSSQFSRAFKQQIGVAPRDYILERRLHRARELLEETDHALCDVALDAGFSSQAHLTSMFAREFGMPPGQYRKLISARDIPAASGSAGR